MIIEELKLMLVEGEGRKMNEGVKVKGGEGAVMLLLERRSENGEENDVFFLIRKKRAM